MITENLSTLKIHKLTQAQYDREREAGNIDENALYLTPDNSSTVDSELSIESENPVQNKVIAHAFKEVEDRLSVIPVFETREEIFNQTLTTETTQSQVAIDNFNLSLQHGETYYITINGTTYQTVAFVDNDMAALSNGLSNDDKDFVAIQITFGENGSVGIIKFSATGAYDLIISKPIYSVIEIDTELSETSENPVQNKVITEALNGITPSIGENGNWFVGGADTGVKAQGEKGDTPVKGVDYFTEEDKAEIVRQVLASLPTS